MIELMIEVMTIAMGCYDDDGDDEVIVMKGDDDGDHDG
jgi:hypothetical protein